MPPYQFREYTVWFVWALFRAFLKMCPFFELICFPFLECASVLCSFELYLLFSWLYSLWPMCAQYWILPFWSSPVELSPQDKEINLSLPASFLTHSIDHTHYPLILFIQFIVICLFPEKVCYMWMGLLSTCWQILRVLPWVCGALDTQYAFVNCREDNS